MNRINVVVDTNVFIKAIFHDDEWCKKIFQLKSNNKIKFFMNKDMHAELLITFFKIQNAIQDNCNSKADYSRFLVIFLSSAMWQIEEIEHNTNVNLCIDPDDNKFIDCCIDGNVKYLITCDNHLNSISSILKKKYNIEVLSPYQFYLSAKKILK